MRRERWSKGQKRKIVRKSEQRRGKVGEDLRKMQMRMDQEK